MPKRLHFKTPSSFFTTSPPITALQGVTKRTRHRTTRPAKTFLPFGDSPLSPPDADEDTKQPGHNHADVADDVAADTPYPDTGA